MLKMGLPEGAVRNKMLQDGVEDPEGLWAECEAVRNGSNGHKPEPELEPYNPNLNSNPNPITLTLTL